MDENTFETLELDPLLELLARHVQTPMGRKRVLALRPFRDRTQIDLALDQTTECREYHGESGSLGLAGLSDPEDALARLQIEGARLDAQQILILERLLAACGDLRSALVGPEVRQRYPVLSALGSTLPDLRRLLGSITGKILPNGEIDDNASPELRRIRREILVCRTRIHRALESIMRGQERAVQEEIVTFRNGRFVIPLRTDSRNLVPGVMHGLSSSGQTSYVEPLTVISQNNDLVRLRESEESEIAAILQSITDSLRSRLPEIRQCASVVTELDVVQAKARLSEEFGCVRPDMTDGPTLSLRDARHPLLDHALRQSGAKAVPVSFTMDADHPIMVISGPNAGGKTVALKTTGLLAFMAQMGLHVPASEALVPVFRQVFADIGDQQSMAANLSTFTAHVMNIAEMAARISPPTLLLIDEVGTGTDPDEGAALSVAIVDYFRRRNTMVIATTHYNRLKMWASRTEGVLNASVEFDTRSLSPTYRLIVGVAGASSGLQIAERMSLPPEILAAARANMEPGQLQAAAYLHRIKSLVDEQESLRAALEQERRATAEKYDRLDADFVRKEEKRRTEFEAAIAEALRGITAEGHEILESLEERAAANRLKKQLEVRVAGLRRKTARSTAAHAPPTHPEGARASSPGSPVGGPGAEIREDDRVLIKSLNKEGVVESTKDDLHIVAIGPLRFRATRDDLDLLERPAAKDHPKTGVSIISSAAKDFSAELKVIGMTADEALDRVDKFLDDAFLADAESVRIIHGHGKGILRRAISGFLGTHSLVERFGPAPAGQGGAGATVVTLKKE